MDRLTLGGIQCYSPQVHRVKADKSEKKKKLGRLLPGYVFIESIEEPDWLEIRRIPGVLRILSYPDGSHALRGADTAFIAWLKRFATVIEVSLVIQIGTKIHFIEGPLKDMQGHIVKVNKKRRAVAIQFGSGDGLFQTIWCSFDYVQEKADSAAISNRYE